MTSVSAKVIIFLQQFETLSKHVHEKPHVNSFIQMYLWCINPFVLIPLILDELCDLYLQFFFFFQVIVPLSKLNSFNIYLN